MPSKFTHVVTNDRISLIFEGWIYIYECINSGIVYIKLYIKWASLVAQMVKNPPAMQETWVQSLGWEDPLEEGMAIHSSITAWRIPLDRGAWQTTIHGVTESDATEWLSTAQHAFLRVKEKKESEVAQSCLTLCDPMDCSLSGSSVHGDSSGKKTGVSCHVLLQGIFPTQGLNPGLLHCGWILYHLSHQGNPK